MATNYQRGRAFEYRVRDKLKKDGAVYVLRAAQSKGIVDLLALFPPAARCTECAMKGLFQPVIWLVQAKRDGRLPAHEEIELRAVAEAAGAVPVLAQTGPKGRGVQFVFLGG